MISTTVRRQQTNNNSADCLSTRTAAATGGELVDNDTLVEKFQLNKPKPKPRKQISSIKTTTLASSAEFQHAAAKEYISLIDTPPQTPTYEKFFNLQHQTSEQTQISLLTPTIDSQTKTISQNQINNRTDFNKQQKNKLHSRSISLIVNPEFINSESDNIELSSLRRRKSLPRRARLRLVKPETQKMAESNERQIPDLDINNNNTHQLQVELNDSSDGEDNKFKSVEINKNTINLIETESSSSPDILEQFRQTGEILRQISDEFEK